VTLPVLHGPRVSLVPVAHPVAVAVVHGAGLAAALAPLAAGEGWPHEDTADALRPLAEHGAPGDDGGWLVVVDGAVVGDCGWKGGPGPDGEVEVGYGVASAYRGQGLGTEAVGLLCAWAEQQPGVRRLLAQVLPGNEPSVRLLRRLGFVDDGASGPWRRMVR
jgi:[ribosomal protein S5]-alanine N-acetyltransferase